MHKRTRAMVAGAACALLLGVAACSSSMSGQSSSDGMIAQLTFPAEVSDTVGGLVNYNPYSPNPLTSTWLYEPVMVRNGLSCTITPWLATGYSWQGTNQLTFTMRDGVEWSDGKPFTAEDVAFTYNLMHKYPAIDKAGIWNDTFGAPATSVTASGDSVVLTFSGNAASKFDDIIKQPILPEHVYQSVGDPSKYIDKSPVGTGPFKVDSYNGRRLVLARRPDYWQADKIKVKKLVLEGSYEASEAALKLKSGGLDAYWGEIPNPQKAFVAADPAHNHFYYAPAGTTVLDFNLTKAPFNDVRFREAVSYAINRPEISAKATYGIMKPASQTGLKLPFTDAYLPSEYTDAQTVLPYDAAKASQLLDAAGYRKGPDRKRTLPDGSPLNLTFSVQAGFIDYDAMADVITRDFNDVGVTTKIETNAPDSVDAQKKSGDFQALLEYVDGGCQFATGLGARLASNQIPTKTDVLPNVERWRDAATDQEIAQLSATVDKSAQKQLVGKLVDTMMTQFPVTALVYAPTRIIYRTDKAVGWPTEQDPYAHPADNRLLIMTHLKPAPAA
ncbi:ABC transporter substrate-binding protein [Rugosimonospora africana]|uniref:Peptide ABC transporter substrate-binding protein n=1 Tax=Rugosimonospora africana TaxID=556532 RepID=A0A8J3R2A2_9ACTN|nr:ABC transporter substrate-binding protein [Rugosimonospora africana]GIH20459.1 peptide ABC transporter substrate-binding protein [Rugosimonospora africana]